MVLNRTDEIEILLVEDNPGDVCLIREALKLGSIRKRLQVVEDGEAALHYLRGEVAPRPGLILLDLNLPKIDGREVLGEIKKDPELRHIPVIILTTSDSENDVVSAYEHHANCYLTKPQDLFEYLDLIENIEAYWLSAVCLPA